MRRCFMPVPKIFYTLGDALFLRLLALSPALLKIAFHSPSSRAAARFFADNRPRSD